MANSTDIPPKDAFNHIADVFLTPREEDSSHPPVEEFEYPALEFGRGKMCSVADHARASSHHEVLSSPPNAPARSEPKLKLTPEDVGTNSEQVVCDNKPAEDHLRKGTFISEPGEVNISLIYACHLPVQGRVWLNQLAAAVARRSGSTCFIRRMADDALTADFFPDGSSAEPNNQAFTSPSSEQTARTSVNSVIRNIFPITKEWLIHIQNLEDVALPACAERITAKRVILATSADPIALVGVYRTLKMLVSKLQPQTVVELMFVGSTSEPADRAFARIASAARGFLNRPVSCMAVLPRIEPVTVTHLGDFPFQGYRDNSINIADEIGRLIYEVNADRASHATCATVPSSETVEESGAWVPEFAGDETDPDGAVFEEIALEDELPELIDEEQERVRDDFRLPPSMIELVPGLIDLLARSPKAPGIELAIDAEDCVHALCSDEDGEDGCDAVARLLSVCDWIESHSSIIRLLRTYPESHLPNQGISGPPLHTEAHLFTACPQQYRRLIDGRLRVHLLALKDDVAVSTTNEIHNTATGQLAEPCWIHVPIN